MAVYRPGRKGAVSKFYVCEFILHGKRIQESTGCESKTAAKEYEKKRRAELQRAAAGLPVEDKAPRLRSVAEVTKSYLEGYRLNHRPASIVFAEARLRQVNKLLGSCLLSELTADRIRSYIRQRLSDATSGRTINMELGELSRSIGHTWRELWPKVKKLEERKDVGRALSVEEQHQLLDGLEKTRSQTLRTLIPVLLRTGMRSGEATGLHWFQLDLMGKAITVGRAKTSSGTGRVIPINRELGHVLAAHRAWFVERFGEPEQDDCVFPFGHPVPLDSKRHITDITWAWDELREATGVRCRLHDLRHTFATALAERGTPESTMLALMGHMSKAMLERYSHIRMKAKIEAVEGISLKLRPKNSEPVPVKVRVPEPGTSIQ